MPEEPIKLNPPSYVILGLLKWMGEGTPYEIRQFLEQSVENFWPVPHTTAYSEPARLARGGYLSEQQEDGGRRRKLYALTEKGEAALEDWVRTGETGPPVLRDDGMLKIFMGADPVPILAERDEWHRRKLEELEGYLAAVDEAGAVGGVRTALLAGLAYHRLLQEAIAEFLATVRDA